MIFILVIVYFVMILDHSIILLIYVSTMIVDNIQLAIMTIVKFEAIFIYLDLSAC